MSDDNVEIIQEEPASWLATFADLATLLFTFYCLIYGSCTYRPGKWETKKSPALEKMLTVLAGGTKTSLVSGSGDGGLSGYNAIIPLLTNPFRMSPEERAEVEENLEDMIHLAEENQSLDQLNIETTEEGIRFRFADPIMFGSGMAEPTPAVYPLLRSIAAIIRSKPCEVTVEGHTDDIPSRSPRWPSNWELSATRAASIVRFLEKQGLGRANISAVACGQFYPRFDNDGELNRRRNRRVEIMVKFNDPYQT